MRSTCQWMDGHPIAQSIGAIRQSLHSKRVKRSQFCVLKVVFAILFRSQVHRLAFEPSSQHSNYAHLFPSFHAFNGCICLACCELSTQHVRAVHSIVQSEGERKGQCMSSSNQTQHHSDWCTLDIAWCPSHANYAKWQTFANEIILYLVRLIALSSAVRIGFAKIGNWILHSSHRAFRSNFAWFPLPARSCASYPRAGLYSRFFRCSCFANFLEYLHMTLIWHAFSINIINSRGMHSASLAFISNEWNCVQCVPP